MPIPDPSKRKPLLEKERSPWHRTTGARAPLRALQELGDDPGAEDVLDWAFRSFAPEIAVSSSFQTQSLPLLHLVSRVCPDLRVVFLDTGYHFPETLSFRDRVVTQFDLRLEVVRAEAAGPRDDTLYRRDPDLCCFKNKVEPFLSVRKTLRAWVSGIRRDQTQDRRETPVVDRLPDGVFKICPLVSWSGDDVEEYLIRHRLPRHPLDALGYSSIGCQPCTRVPEFGSDPRSGRWAGQAKTECGLHLEPNRDEDS